MLRRILFLVACAALASLAGSVPAFSQQSAPAPGIYSLMLRNTPFLPGSTVYRLGGFSGLQYLGGNEFMTITDRGPNVDSGDAKVFLLPNFQPMMVRFRANADGSLTILGTTPIQRTGFGRASGLPEPAPYYTGEGNIDTNFNQVPFDDWGFDTEGLVRAADGTYWFCEEYAPGIAHLSASGEILQRVRPQTTPGGLPDILRKHVPNRGAEGIAVTPNGKVYTIVQSGMANSYANTASADKKASQNTELLRLVEYDPATGNSRMFAYMMDAYPTGGNNVRRRDIKIGDMVALNDNELMLIEHAQRGTENVKKIYKINLSGATPITSEVYQTSPGVFKALEELSRDEIASVAGLTPVSKTLVLDLLNADAGNPVWPVEADKPEGMTLIDPSTIAVCNDNDFGVVSTNSDGKASLSGNLSRLFVFHLSSPLNVQTAVDDHSVPTTGVYALPLVSTPLLQGSNVFKLGGFSGLQYLGGNEFMTITDRGPNVDSGDAKVFLLPNFQPTMVRFRANANGSLSILQTLPISKPVSGRISGLPEPAPYYTGEGNIDTNFNQVPFDDWGFDTEGLVRAADGTYWFCEEYAPGIAHLSASGEILQRVRPQTTPGGLPDILRKHVPNRGAEGIAVTPNGKVYTIVQSGMANSYDNTASADKKASQNTELLRLVEYDPATGNSRMFAYMMDAYPTGGNNVRRRDIKIGDMVALNDNELMLIEHAQRGTENVKKIYKINLSGATPITGEVYQTSPGVFKALEELSRDEIASVAGLTPVSKTLVLDLLNAGAGNPVWPVEADKPEGMTLIDPSTIAVCNDNDFGVISTNSDGKASLTGNPSRLFVFHLSSPLNVQTAPVNPPHAPVAGVFALQTNNAPLLPGSSMFRLGGFSGLSYAGGNEFWTITDRGPNVDSGDAKVFLLPNFQPTMVRFRANANGSLSILQTQPITAAGGGAVSGLPEPAPYYTGEGNIDTNFNQVPFDDWGFDTEGLVRAADGTYWFCEEYAPGIAHLSASGEILQRVRPQTTPGGLPDILRKHVPNRGAEGIAVTPNGKVYTIVQSGMANSYDNTASADKKASQNTELLRLVEYDPATGNSRMFAYMMDAYPTGGNNVRRRDIKIGDMVALNDNELMLIEHAQRGTENVKKVYKINLSGATPITGEVYQTSPGVFKALEELSRDEIASVAGLTPVSKTLVLDLLNAGAGNPAWPVEADKPEGMTLIDPSTIAVCNDNDFGVVSTNSDGKASLTGNLSRLFVFKLGTPLNFQTGIQASITQGATDLVASRVIFDKTRTCVGEGVVSLPITVTNTGNGPMAIYGVDMFSADSVMVQGLPGYRLQRDQRGRAIPSTDYVLTAAPATFPLAANQPFVFPATLPQGGSFTFYANFAPQRAGNRFARVFIRTNATNFSGIDTDDVAPRTPNWGLFTVDLLGHGNGGSLSADATGLPVKPVVFPTTQVGDKSDMTFTLANAGACTLHISRKVFEISAGDVTDFSIVSAFSGIPVDPATNDYILTPGMSTSVTVRFTPQRSGSRRATLWLRSNDSSATIPGVSERGSIYVDLYGIGNVQLAGKSLALATAAIGRDTLRGSVSIYNETRERVMLTSLKIAGPDAGDFAMSSPAWPATPYALDPGQSVELGVAFQPAASGMPGARSAWIIGLTSVGDSVRAMLTATAGTRTISVTPKSLFTMSSLPSGKGTREIVTVQNTGTMPVTIGTLRIVGADSLNYGISSVSSSMIDAGANALVEVSFSPRKSGASQAKLIIANDASQLDTVTLGGTGTKAQRRVDEGSSVSVGSYVWDANSQMSTARESSPAAVAGESIVNSTKLFPPVPSPVHDRATIVYQLAARGEIVLELFDAQGALVRTLATGSRDAGRHAETIDVTGLPSGAYRYRLQAGGEVLTQTMIVVN